MNNVNIKICKICNEEKPLKEYHIKSRQNNNIYYDSKCKVCCWFNNKALEYKSNDWSMESDRYIVDCILNQKRNINEITIDLNKTLKETCIHIKDFLKIGGNFKLTVILTCDMCKKEYEGKPHNIANHNHTFCSKQCNKEWLRLNPKKPEIIGTRKCLVCDKEFDVIKTVKNHKYCSVKCRRKNYKTILIDVKCSNCQKDIKKPKSSLKKYNNFFCCKECDKEFKYNKKWEFRKCEICKSEFECLKSSTKRFCNIKCQGKWQSKTLIGENANNFNKEYSLEDRVKICEWCELEFNVKPYKINMESVRFCSDKCRQNWYAQIYSQTDEWRDKSRKRAVKILEDNLIPNSLTSPQIKINQILDELNISYINEKGFKYYCVDNYLEDFNLILEIMGGYWHCDHRTNLEINYKMQLNRIIKDKAKNTYITSKLNVPILYLWEEDINNSIDICKELIKYFIENKGIIQDYHSFNYELNNGLILKNNIEMPYFKRDINEVNKLVSLEVKKIMSKKDPTKWITFNCEVCGKEKEELISHYNTKERHFCSRECVNIGTSKKIEVKCEVCNKKYLIKLSTYKRNKSKKFFCCRDCNTKYRRKHLDKEVVNGFIYYNCDYCGKEHRQNPSDYNKSESHFCSISCATSYNNKNRNK